MHRTFCPSGLRGWTQVSLAQAAWAQIPQVSYAVLVYLGRLSFEALGTARMALYEWTLSPGSFLKTRLEMDLRRWMYGNDLRIPRRGGLNAHSAHRSRVSEAWVVVYRDTERGRFPSFFGR